MMERTLAKRYAAAMLGVAIREGIVADVEGQLLALKEAFEKDALFRNSLSQPKIPRAARRKILLKPFEGRAHQTLLDFLGLLVEKNRVALIPEIADAFDLLADATQGVVRVDVHSAHPLTEPQRASLSDRLVRITGKKIQLQETVDRTLRGGMFVKIGDSIVDGTIARRLKGLRERLTALQRV
jgi:F-type H+-transporting ATPase subunit delta